MPCRKMAERQCILSALAAWPGAMFRVQRESLMQSAVILIDVEKGQINAVAQRLAELEGISEVFSTCGRYDLVAIARTRDFESLAQLVTERLMQVEGIHDTETLNAMQVHSRHDLETMFSLGW